MNNIAIFASGNGSNAENIINYFKNSRDTRVMLVLSNNKDAKVLERAKKSDIETVTFSKNEFYNTTEILKILNSHQISLIVLAGFLWLIPDYFLQAFPRKIINIHPALLPKYGGKGMYGAKVHESVIKNCDTESGITIHFVDEVYDNGEIIFQATCPIEPTETPESLAQKIHLLEYHHFPETIQNLIASRDFI